MGYANPGCMGLVGAPTYPMLRDVTRATFLNFLEESEVPHRFIKSENSVFLDEPKSLVIFRSLDAPTRLVGTNLAWFGVDELTYSKEDAWRRLEARLRDPKAKLRRGFAAWTPKGFDWVWQRFVSPDAVVGYGFVQAKRDNPAITPEFYEALKNSYDERFYQQEVEGKYLSLFAGQAYYAFDRTNNVHPVAFDPRHPLCWALDFNINPMASVLCQMIGGDVRVLKEIVLPNSNTTEACGVFRERVQPYLDAVRGNQIGIVPLQVKVYGDPAGNQRRSSADKTDWRIIKDAFADWRELPVEYFVPASHPTIKARVNAVNAMLRNAHGLSRLIIDPSCRELIADMDQVAWKTDSDSNPITELDKSNAKRTHVSDALGYLIEKEFGLKNYGGPRSSLLI
jgi:hypothetical protein